jgi:hypothetical protein
VVGIVWELDLQLSLQSVHITTKVASSNSAHDRQPDNLTEYFNMGLSCAGIVNKVTLGLGL